MPAKRDVCAPPSMPAQLEEVAAFDLDDGESVDDVLVNGADLAGRRARGFGIRSSRLAGTMLQSCELQWLDARDVVFENCDLSGSDLSESRLERVALVGCRLSGVVLSRSVLKDVRVRDCKLDGVNLRMTEGERVWISDSNLRDADFYEAKFRSSRMLDCDLTGSEFSKADLSGTHLQGSRLDGAKGAGGLRGIRIDSDQATLLAGLLLELHDIAVEGAPED